MKVTIGVLIITPQPQRKRFGTYRCRIGLRSLTRLRGIHSQCALCVLSNLRPPISVQDDPRQVVYKDRVSTDRVFLMPPMKCVAYNKQDWSGIPPYVKTPTKSWATGSGRQTETATKALSRVYSILFGL